MARKRRRSCKEGGAVWALVHGLAFVYFDGKLDASAVSGRVRAAVHALVTASAPD